MSLCCHGDETTLLPWKLIIYFPVTCLGDCVVNIQHMLQINNKVFKRSFLRYQNLINVFIWRNYFSKKVNEDFELSNCTFFLYNLSIIVVERRPMDYGANIIDIILLFSVHDNFFLRILKELLPEVLSTTQGLRWLKELIMNK